jgi:hypothetical protein
METTLEAPKRKRGRPAFEYTEEIGEEICQRIAAGETIVEICGSEGMPCWETLRRWLFKYPEFTAQYTRAREFYSEYRNDQFRYEGKINPPTTPEGVANRRIDLDHMKWELSKHAPKKFGDKIAMEHDVQHKFIPLDELADKVRKIQLENNRMIALGGPAAPENPAEETL